MKKCLIILLLGLLSFVPTATAQEPEQPLVTQKPLMCHTADEIMRILTEEYEEKPILMGKEPLMLPNGRLLELHIQLWVNVKKGSYSIVQSPPQVEQFVGKLCILSAGDILDLNIKEIRLLLGDQFI